MPTNRPFFANFLAAFRAHSALTKATAQSSVTPTTTASTTFSSPSSLSRPITTTASNTKHPPTIGPTSSPSASTTAAVNHHLRHTSQSPVSMSPPRQGGFGAMQRRGSDSSSDSGGFREVLGGEKWYVGGRTAAGEERFLKLGMVRKNVERRSLDQLSL